ncbi:MAG: hypothetical protein E6J90_50920 [Deltaproteobacteria bacterium]|nr:MAG: hypothetical protein E6J90_50920 [Deltaproteobacteria bacterium]TMQ10214.1 MAG: hypothetical protein E6J91_27545 [Deltaproteobacteria bacterium]
MTPWAIWVLSLVCLYAAGIITGYWLRGALNDDRVGGAMLLDDTVELPPATLRAIRRAARKRRADLREALRR